MRFNEKDLHKKLYKMKDADKFRRETVDAICKYWEGRFGSREMALLQRNMGQLQKKKHDRGLRKNFRKEGLSLKITNQSITKSKKKKRKNRRICYLENSFCEKIKVSVQKEFTTSMQPISTEPFLTEIVSAKR